MCKEWIQKAIESGKVLESQIKSQEHQWPFGYGNMSHEQFEVGKQQVDKWFSSFREDLSKLDSHKEQDLIMDISSDSIVVAEVEDSAALCGAIKRVLDTLESLSH